MVVPNFQLRYAGAFLFGGLDCGYFIFYIARKVAQVVKLRIVPGVYNAAVLERRGRLLLYGGIYQRFYVVKGINPRANIRKQRRLRSHEQTFKLRQMRRARRKGFVFPGACVPENNAGHHPLKVMYSGKLRRNISGEHGVVQQCFNGIQAFINLYGIQQRTVDICPQKPPSHGGVGFVQHPKQRSALFPAPHGFRKLQIAARR